MQPIESHSFETPDRLERWFRANHQTERELWVRIFKKSSSKPSVNWNDCVVAALCWGWIDGQRKSLDEVSFLQRLTPRRPKSDWSQKNSQHAERLMLEGRMQPAGLAQIEAARVDGRWERAYAGSAEMVIPEDFLAELHQNVDAERFFATLNRRNLYAIYHRVQTAKRSATRAKRIAEIVAQLARGEVLH